MLQEVDGRASTSGRPSVEWEVEQEKVKMEVRSSRYPTCNHHSCLQKPLPVHDTVEIKSILKFEHVMVLLH
jgi:hypothetical protein